MKLSMKKLSIIIPVYNEVNTLKKILEKIEKVKLPLKKELILIDDGSKDGSRELLGKLKGKYKVLFHEVNQGKGSSIKTGIDVATGDYAIIQDADLEYDPRDYKPLVNEILRSKMPVVYGSRNLKENKRSKMTYYLGGKLVTAITNFLYGSHLTDVNTCYKLFDLKFLKSLNIERSRFNFCEEVTAKTLRKGIKITELPINYYPRSEAEGKKLKYKDGVRSLLTLLKYRFVRV